MPAQSSARNALLLLLILPVLVSAVTTVDDANSTFFDFATGIWNHGTCQARPIHDGTISYSDDKSASYKFSFTGTGFQIFAGRKKDRGKFLVDIDGAFAGSGDAMDSAISDDSDRPTALYTVKDLEAADHNCTVWNYKDETRCNGGVCFLVLDFVTFEQTMATTTLEPSSSADYPSRSDLSSNSYGGGSEWRGNSSGGMSSGAIAGVAIGASVATLGLVGACALIWLCWRRRRGPFRQRAVIDADEDNMSQAHLNTGLGYSSVGYHPSVTSSSSSYQGSQRSPQRGVDSEQQDAFMGRQPPSYDMASAGFRDSLISASAAPTSSPATSESHCSSPPQLPPGAAMPGSRPLYKGAFNQDHT